MSQRHVRAHFLFVGLMILVAARVGFAQQTGKAKLFEGVLEFKKQTFDRVQFFNYYVKDDRLRFESAEYEDTSPIIIVDYLLKRTYCVLPHREQYAELERPPEPSPGQPQMKEQPEVTKTDQTEEIEGFGCDQFLVKTEEGEMEIWATKEIGIPGTFYMIGPDAPLSLTPWQKEIVGQGYFPIRTVVKDDEGEEVSRFELSSVKRKVLSESLLRFSPEYEKIGLEQLKPKPAPKKGRTK